MSAERLAADGPAAPPRANGELVFEAPWESRLFGLTHALCDAGQFTWGDFQRALIAAIAAWEREAAPGTPYRYYERWLAALERILAAQALVARAELDEMERALAVRPHGHDH